MMSADPKPPQATPEVTRFRQDLHLIPELGFEENETSRYLAKALRGFGCVFREGIAKTGIHAQFDSGKPGNTVLLRFDMDGLPISEDTGLAFMSRHEGCMHACGHDGHMAIGLSIAQWLAKDPSAICGKVHLIFQPAEEISQGAQAVIREGLLEETQPDFVLSAHLWAEKPYGWIGVTPGSLMAGSTDLAILVSGKGGHGGKPENTVDPLLVSSHIIIALQAVISRSLPPNRSAVLSVTKIKASDRHNIIANQVSMFGTLRWFDHATRELMNKRITEIAEGIARGFGAVAEVSFIEKTIPVTNDHFVASVCQESAESFQDRVQGLVVDTQYQTMISEDFAYFTEQVPGAMVLVGAGIGAEGEAFPHHHPKFDIDERALTLAVDVFKQTIIKLTSIGVS